MRGNKGSHILRDYPFIEAQGVFRRYLARELLMDAITN